MKITVTFDSLEEFQQHVTTGWGAVTTTIERVPKAKEEPEAPKPEKKPKKDEKPAEKPAEAPEEPKPEDPVKEEVTMEQVRKILADLNKKAGKNIAKDLIKQIGFKKLTEVPEGALPTLKSLAEEEARTYA